MVDVGGDYDFEREEPEDSRLLDDEDRSDGEEELTGCGATICCDPRRGVHRYIVLVFMCFLSFGSYFCYDNPGAIQDHITEDMQVDVGKFMSLYSWYSWPNVVLCFFGGFMIDRVFGVRVGGILFSSFVTVGQVVFALGAFINKFWVMDLGRFIFGLGGESLAVVQNTYAVSWFKGKELNMVFGLQLSFSRVGSTVNFNVMGALYDFLSKSFSGTSWGEHGYNILGLSLFVAGIFCVLSLLMAIAMAIFDWRATRILKSESASTGEVIRLRDVKDFPITFWLLSLICVAYYVTVFPFIGLGLVYFEMKFGYSPGIAENVNSIVYILSAVASPIFGFFIDKTGKNIFWVLTGVIVTLGCHALLCFTFINAYVGMVTMGLAYSILASALWPMVAQIIPEYQLGTAYGIMQSVQNLGLAVISMVAGKLVDTNGYLILEVFFQMWLCLALVTTVILYLIDAARGGTLNASAKTRRQKAMAERIAESTNHD